MAKTNVIIKTFDDLIVKIATVDKFVRVTPFEETVVMVPGVGITDGIFDETFDETFE